jgi:hypothetical protein
VAGKVAAGAGNFPARPPVSINTPHHSAIVMGNDMKAKSNWVYVAGAAVACAGIIGVSTLAANADTTSGAAPLQFGSGGDVSASAAPPSTGPSGRPSSAEPPTHVLGDVVTTGYGKWVLYAVEISDSAIPHTSFGLMAGVHGADGSVKGVVETNETTGSDKSPGFHAIEGSMDVDGKTSPTFGYYVGPAAKITGVAGGKTLTAGEAAWSKNSAVHFFWFGSSASISKLAAFDKSGHKLPTGNASIGVG